MRTEHALGTLLAQAWARHPMAVAAQPRLQAAQAQQAAARSLWAGAPAVVLQAVSGGPGRAVARTGGRSEIEAGLAWPVWRVGERALAQQRAQASLQLWQARLQAERWQLAGALRETWWAVWRAQADAQAAQARAEGLQRLQADVARRVAAGDLARADGHQAAMAVAQAQAAEAEAQSRHQQALSSLQALTGELLGQSAQLDSSGLQPEPGMPLLSADAQGEPGLPQPEDHPLLSLAHAQQAEAAAHARWQAVAADAPPELTVLGTRGREQAGEGWRQSVTVGLRWPLGDGGETPTRRLQAQADQLEAETATAQTAARLKAEWHSAQARWQAMVAQWQATQRQARLAQEAQGFWVRAFELGEADLPTRLRAEQEAHQSLAALARAEIECRAAWSAWLQAQGRMPEAAPVWQPPAP
jgi:cobalt-zinc-cadmium efflux system outer membrane protein